MEQIREAEGAIAAGDTVSAEELRVKYLTRRATGRWWSPVPPSASSQAYRSG